MNKRLSKSGIEYLDYSWGVWSGCRNLQAGICSVNACWAKGIANHYPALYPNGFEPTFYPEALGSPLHLRKPSIIGVGWVGDVIGYGLQYRDRIFHTIERCPQHTFLFLTKNPEKLLDWAPFPDNAWPGVTITNLDMAVEALPVFALLEAKIKFASYEPLLERVPCKHTMDLVDWVAIGGQTRPTRLPEIAYVQEIVQAADKAGVKVFLKDNLKPLFSTLTINDKWVWAKDLGYGGLYRQEMPR